MAEWELYETTRWVKSVCRNKISQLRQSKKYSAVKLGVARMYHGKAFYHILVQPQ